MKKLMMTAAAMTIACGAYAQCGYPTPGPGVTPVNAALVYSVRMNAKTTVAKYLKGTIQRGSSTVCGYGGGAYTNDYVVYREPGNVNLTGYWMNCTTDCTEDADGLSSYDTAMLWMWETRSKSYWFNDGEYGVAAAPAFTKYWDATATPPLQPLATDVPRAIIQWGPADMIAGWDIGPSFYGVQIRNPFNLIGRNNTKVEAFWNIGRIFTLPQFVGAVNTVPPRAIAIYGAGIGTFNSNLGVIRTITGNFAGLIDAPYYVSRDICEPAVAFDCCSCEPLYNQSVFYGTWSMKYNPALSKLAVTDASRIYTTKCPQNYQNKDYRSNDYRWHYAF
ncbi:MAG: hypothetical protein PHO37_07595 [Kiritimatiellae bacterium]|nr:hypothetical protein [Kiritimatiellia bacterium]